MHGREKDGASSGFALILSLISGFHFAPVQLSVFLTAWRWALLVHTVSAYQKLKFVWRSNWPMNAKSGPVSFRDAKGKYRYIQMDICAQNSMCSVSQNAEIGF